MPQNPFAATIAVKGGAAAPALLDTTGNLIVGKATKSSLNITTGTVVKATAGRIVKVNVTTAGAVGTLSDCATTGAVAAANLVWVIPATVGTYDLDFPCLVGIVATPGAAQVVSVSFD